jgi:ABC-2 type transport system ATP-binding protein
MSTLLEVSGIRKRYERHLAVDGVSFSVAAGTIFGLLGPNGAGKTTTIRMIMDIIAPDEGTIYLFGKPRDERSNQDIGYLPEERGLYRKMTVIDNLRFLAEIRGLRRSEAQPRIEDWLAKLELTAWAPRKVEELSKGMQQKVQFIGTVLHDPKLLILDEPFSGLDPLNTIVLKDVMLEARARGVAIIFSTHVLEQAEKLCDQICLIKGGVKILDGTLAEVREQYRTPSFLVRGEGLDRLRSLPQVSSVEMPVDGSPYARVVLEKDPAPGVFLREASQVATIDEVRPDEPDLESIYVRAVRDAGE